MNTNPYTYKSTPAFLPINREIFIEGIKKELFSNKLSELQLEVIHTLLYECESQGLIDIRGIAYAFASSYHDCYRPNDKSHDRMTPCNERGAMMTLKSQPYYPYYGRGLSLIRGKPNYKKESDRTGHDLIYNPDLMLDVKISSNSHIYCLINGVFYGRKLGDFIYSSTCDYNKCRRILTGIKDRFIVSKYALIFENHLRNAIIGI